MMINIKNSDKLLLTKKVIDMLNKKIFKLILSIVVICIIIILINLNFNVSNITLYINWKILLPKPSSETTIFKYEYREGEDLEIWHYTSENNIYDLSKKMNKINDINEIKSILEKYYSYLNEEEKIKFKSSVDYDSILDTNNYYLYKKENNEKRMLLLIFSENSKKLYMFNVNH